MGIRSSTWNLIGALFLAATLLPGTLRAADPARPEWDAESARKHLDTRIDWWLNWSGSSRGHGTACVSCHTLMPLSLARPLLGAHVAESGAAAAETKLINNVKARVENWEKIVSGSDDGDDPIRVFYLDKEQPSLGTEAVLNALLLVNDDHRRAKGVLSPPTREALAHLWEQQQENGAWLWLDFGLNPWEKDGAYYGASLAAIAVGTAGKEYYGQAELQSKLAALKKFLKTQHAGQPLHHRLLGLWAASWLPALFSEEVEEQLIQELFSVQEADGGWSLPKLGQDRTGKNDWHSYGIYPEGTVSDGYATGLVVLALKRARVPAMNPKLKKGIAWLADNQRDGTWPASYLNVERDPNSDAAKFMRDAATSFAILALVEPTP